MAGTRYTPEQPLDLVVLIAIKGPGFSKKKNKKGSVVKTPKQYKPHSSQIAPIIAIERFTNAFDLNISAEKSRICQ